MKFLFILSLFTCLSTIGYSQNTDPQEGGAITPPIAVMDTNKMQKVYTVVQIPAEFPGGIPAWSKYLERNLDVSLGARYLKIPKGQDWAKQTVYVTFIVGDEGTISDVQVVNKNEVHPKLAAEAVRVIQDGPRWKPAIQNGKKVIYRHKQGITWVVQRNSNS